MRNLGVKYEVDSGQLKEDFREISVKDANGQETGEIIISLKDDSGKETGLYVKGLKENSCGYDPFWDGYEPAHSPETATFFLKKISEAQIVDATGGELINFNTEKDLIQFNKRDTQNAKTSISVSPNGNYFIHTITYGPNYGQNRLSTLYSAEGHKLLIHDGAISRDNKNGYVQIQIAGKGVSIPYSREAATAKMQEMKQSEFWKSWGKIIEAGVKKDPSYSSNILYRDNPKAFNEIKVFGEKTNDLGWETFNTAVAYQKMLAGYEQGPITKGRASSRIRGNPFLRGGYNR